MADGAIARQPELHVRWIIAVIEIGRVARITLRRRSLEHVIDMACDAGQRGVRTGKWISRVLQVFELGIEPAVHRVAALARIGQAKPDVIENWREEILLVAGVAGGRKAHELADSGLLVALVALHQGMGSHQREAILVVLNRLERGLPAFDRVAVGTIGAKLAAVYVGVAIRAARTYILEHHAGMALAATHVLVHAAQRISGQVVIEFGIGSDRFPACIAVAVGARNGERPMGIGYLGLGTDAHTYRGTGAGT